jgi:hypothetical protein
LTLPDVITELDLLLPDPTLDLGDLGDLPLKPGHQKRNADITLDEDSYMSSMEQPRGFGRDDDLQLEEDILDIDIGEDREIGGELGELMSGDSFEIGRDAPHHRDVGEDLFDESRLTMDLGGQETPKARESVPSGLGFEDGLDLGFDEPMGFDIGAADTTIQQAEVTPVPQAAPAPEQEMAEAPSAAAPEEHREHSESPLSSARSSIARDVVEESTYHEPVSEEVRRSPSEDTEAAHVRNHAASRKRKVVVDSVTEIKAKVIKAQQADRSRILKDPSFLPRDPTVLALMSLTKTGGLARSVFYPKNIAPELADLLAPDFVKRMAEMKRKRDAGEDKEESPAKQPRLELEIEEPEEEVPISEQPEEQEVQDETMELGADISAVRIGGEEEELVDPGRRTGTFSFPPAYRALLTHSQPLYLPNLTSFPKAKPASGTSHSKPAVSLHSPPNRSLSPAKLGTPCTSSASNSPSPMPRVPFTSNNCCPPPPPPGSMRPRCSSRSSFSLPRMPFRLPNIRDSVTSRSSKRMRCGVPGRRKRTSSKWRRKRRSDCRRSRRRLADGGRWL